MTTKVVTLWSFLTQSSAKREIVCPDTLRVTIEEFAGELKARLKANQLPADAELVQVNWDDTHTTQQLILVRYTGNQASTNVLQYAVGLEQLGNFAYLEKKIYLVPPRLPKLMQTKSKLAYINPEKKVEEGSGKIGCLAISGTLGLIALAWVARSAFMANGVFYYLYNPLEALVPVLFLGGILWLFSRAFKKADELNKKEREHQMHNRQIEQKNQEFRRQNDEIEQWNRAAIEAKERRQENYQRWLQETVEAAYMAKRNDVLGRWSSAVSTTIDQVVQKLFIDRHSQAQQWQEEQKTKEQLAQELKARAEAIF